MGCPLEASWRTVQNVGITRNRKGNAGGGFRRLPGVRRGQWRRTYAWEASGTEERRTWSYMKKTPADHVPHMVRRSSVRRTKRNTSEKKFTFFGKSFCSRITTVYSWGNESLDEVRSSLNLVTSLNQYGIRLRWESDQPGLVDSYGQVNNTEVEEAGREVCLSVRMTDGTWPEEFI